MESCVICLLQARHKAQNEHNEILSMHCILRKYTNYLTQKDHNITFHLKNDFSRAPFYSIFQGNRYLHTISAAKKNIQLDIVNLDLYILILGVH